MQSKSYHQQCASAGCANEADTRIALICRDCWNTAIHEASTGPIICAWDRVDCRDTRPERI